MIKIHRKTSNNTMKKNNSNSVKIRNSDLCDKIIKKFNDINCKKIHCDFYGCSDIIHKIKLSNRNNSLIPQSTLKQLILKVKNFIQFDGLNSISNEINNHYYLVELDSLMCSYFDLFPMDHRSRGKSNSGRRNWNQHEELRGVLESELENRNISSTSNYRVIVESKDKYDNFAIFKDIVLLGIGRNDNKLKFIKFVKYLILFWSPLIADTKSVHNIDFKTLISSVITIKDAYTISQILQLGDLPFESIELEFSKQLNLEPVESSQLIFISVIISLADDITNDASNKLIVLDILDKLIIKLNEKFKKGMKEFVKIVIRERIERIKSKPSSMNAITEVKIQSNDNLKSSAFSQYDIAFSNHMSNETLMPFIGASGYEVNNRGQLFQDVDYSIINQRDNNFNSLICNLYSNDYEFNGSKNQILNTRSYSNITPPKKLRLLHDNDEDFVSMNHSTYSNYNSNSSKNKNLSDVTPRYNDDYKGMSDRNGNFNEDINSNEDINQYIAKFNHATDTITVDSNDTTVTNEICYEANNDIIFR